MIPGSAVYHVVEAMAPLYTSAVLGYASVRWLKAFSDEQCAGINHFVALYAVPVLIFHMVSTNDPYHMNERLIAADTLQKAVVLLALTAWAFWSHLSRRRGGRGKRQVVQGAESPIKWVVTNFSVASLPNTIIMGVPLLDGMYGPVSGGLMKQIVVMQFCIWYNVVIFLYEFMAARDGSARISPAVPATAGERVVDDENGGSSSVHRHAAADRSHHHHQVVVNIEITEVAPAPAAEAVVASSLMPAAATKEMSPEDDGDANKQVVVAVDVQPPVMHVVWMATKKLLQIPNTYASFLGLIWSLMAFKCVSRARAGPAQLVP
jgi:auxin efflux carrier family protein